MDVRGANVFIKDVGFFDCRSLLAGHTAVGVEIAAGLERVWRRGRGDLGGRWTWVEEEGGGGGEGGPYEDGVERLAGCGCEGA